MNFSYRIQSDKGVANSISFIVIIAFVMTLLISFVDVGLYFNTKNQMMSAAENGARSVALYGGVNTEVRNIRGDRNYTPIDVAWDSIPENLQTNRSTVIVNKRDIICGYEDSSGRKQVFTANNKIKAGDLVYCDVVYTYKGIAGKFGLFNLGSDGTVIARGSSVSEVTIE